MVDIKKPMIAPSADQTPPTPQPGVQGMPGSLPGAPTPPPEAVPQDDSGMSPESMKEDIKGKLTDLKGKRAAINSQDYISKNKLDQAKAEMIRAVFDILKNVGVDPTDLESINNFIKQLTDQDPDLLQLFNMAFQALSSSSDQSGANVMPSSPMPDAGGALPVGTQGITPDVPAPPLPPQAPGAPGGAETGLAESPPVATPGEKYGGIAGAMGQ